MGNNADNAGFAGNAGNAGNGTLAGFTVNQFQAENG
jgi:hypothetical protein